MYIAEDLARRHKREWENSGSLTRQERDDLLELLHLEFSSAKSRVGELDKEDFFNSYNSIFNPTELQSTLSVSEKCAAVIGTTPDATNPQPEKTISCPKCHSTQLTANKAGFGLGKAVAGGVLLGGVGLLGGFLGSRKIRITCLACGFTWEAGHHGSVG